MKNAFRAVLVVLLVAALGFIFFNYYSFIFSRTVDGRVEAVQRVSSPMIVSGANEATSRELFSFSVGIKDKTGEIVTASTEDRQWAIVKEGQCAVAKFFPYPPWRLDKGGTYYGARLLRLYECPDAMKPANGEPVAAAPTPVVTPAELPVATPTSSQIDKRPPDQEPAKPQH